MFSERAFEAPERALILIRLLLSGWAMWRRVAPLHAARLGVLRVMVKPMAFRRSSAGSQRMETQCIVPAAGMPAEPGDIPVWRLRPHGHLAVVIDRTDSAQPLMRHALAQSDVVKVAEIHTALAEGFRGTAPSPARLRDGWDAALSALRRGSPPTRIQVVFLEFVA
jgi:hypothetical protein